MKYTARFSCTNGPLIRLASSVCAAALATSEAVRKPQAQTAADGKARMPVLHASGTSWGRKLSCVRGSSWGVGGPNSGPGMKSLLHGRSAAEVARMSEAALAKARPHSHQPVEALAKRGRSFPDVASLIRAAANECQFWNCNRARRA